MSLYSLLSIQPLYVHSSFYGSIQPFASIQAFTPIQVLRLFNLLYPFKFLRPFKLFTPIKDMGYVRPPSPLEETTKQGI